MVILHFNWHCTSYGFYIALLISQFCLKFSYHDIFVNPKPWSKQIAFTDLCYRDFCIFWYGAQYLFKIFQKTKRNSHPQMFFKTLVLKIFAVFTGKHLCWSLFLIKLQAFKHRCFPVNISKCLRTALFIGHLWRLLLNFYLLNCICSYRGVRMIEWMESKTVWKKIKSE